LDSGKTGRPQPFSAAQPPGENAASPASSWLVPTSWRLNLSQPLASAIIVVFIVICTLAFPHRPDAHSASIGKV
jgi:hypothetical protein